nr:hypothetical protein [Jeotgalibacillus malaysiensis]
MEKRSILEQEIRECELLLDDPLILYKNEYLHLIPNGNNASLWSEFWLYAKRRQLVKYYCSVEGIRELKSELKRLKKELKELDRQGA